MAKQVAIEPLPVDGSLEDIYELLLVHTNLGPVQDLLRRYKQSDDVADKKKKELRISGPNARIIVTENLQSAVINGIIPLKEVFAILQEGEENGDQHIFYFKPRNPAARATLKNGEGIAETLLGKGWAKSGRYPLLRLNPKGMCWSDFRFEGKTGWMAKMYRHDIVEEEVGDKPDEDEPRFRWVKMESKQIRSIGIVRWRPDEDLVEVRVSASRSKEILVDLAHQLDPAFSIGTSCVPWDLAQVRHSLFSERKDHAELYSCGDWAILDKKHYGLQGNALTQNPDEKGQLTQKMDELLDLVASDPDLVKKKLVVHWLPTEENGAGRNLRTILGTNSNTHEVIVTSRCSSKALEDVLHQLLEFAK